MNYAFRLTRGKDLKKEIVAYCQRENIKAGVILCAVGCISHLHIRLAEAKDYIDKEENYEIVSITELFQTLMFIFTYQYLIIQEKRWVVI